MVTDQQHILYRMYDATEQLLYIGITLNVEQRFAAHRPGKQWWPDVATIRLEHFATRPELETAEKAAIMAELPIHNRQRKFSSEVALESTRRKRRLPQGLQATFMQIRRHAHRGREDWQVRMAIDRARCGGVSEDDIDWALAHPWHPMFVRKEPASA